MNILFYLTPKSELTYIYEDYTVRQIMEKMKRSKYSVIPVITTKGKFLATISDGDVLRFIQDCDFDKEMAENKEFKDIPLYRPYKALSIDANVEELYELAVSQNFVPVVDDRNVFIGIVTRKDIIKNMIKENGSKKVDS